MCPNNPTGTATREYQPLEVEETREAHAAVEAPPGFEIRLDGVYMHRRSSSNDTEPERICGPVAVEGLARDQLGESWGRLVCWRDMDGRAHRRSIPAQRFHEVGNGLAQELSAEGLEIVPACERAVMKYLGSFRPEGRALCVDAVGWLDRTDNMLTFVLPDRVINATGQEKIVFQPERHSPTSKTISASGTLQNWKDRIASKVSGNPLLMFATCAGLAAPLAKHVGLDGGGFHLYGSSSRGKTTWLQVAASVWGCGADPSQAGKLTMIRRWTVTANGAEGLAAAHNDLILPLDEIGSCTSKEFGALVYMLAGGQGKTAMDATRNLKDVRTWRTMLLSTGEIPSRQQIEEGQQSRARAGQLLRLVDVPGGDRIIQSTRNSNPADYADELKTACRSYYGIAGPTFVERLIEEYGDATTLRGEINLVNGLIYVEMDVKHASAEVRRVCKRFSLLATAGVLACRLGVLPWREDAVVEAVRAVRDLWLDDSNTLTDADRGVIAVRDFCLRNQARFRGADCTADVIPNLAGYRRLDAFLFTSEGFREACGGLNPKVIARELLRRELLEHNEPGHLSTKVTIAGLKSRPRLYIVREAILGSELGE